MTEQEFIANTKKVKGHRVHKFTNSYTVRNYYYYFRKQNKNLTESQFTAALHALFKYLFNELIQGRDAHFGFNMGGLDLRKKVRKIGIVDGKVRTNLPVNWNETLKLWYSDESCKEKKTLVRCDCENIFRINFNKGRAKFKNKRYIVFRTGRKLKLALKKAITENNLDSFSMYES